jgi:hypothetical protein
VGEIMAEILVITGAVLLIIILGIVLFMTLVYALASDSVLYKFLVVGFIVILAMALITIGLKLGASF